MKLDDLQKLRVELGKAHDIANEIVKEQNLFKRIALICRLCAMHGDMTYTLDRIIIANGGSPGQLLEPIERPWADKVSEPPNVKPVTFSPEAEATIIELFKK